MKIAIDLNDVIRDYTNNFIKTYLIYYNREFDTNDFQIWTNDMETLLPFKTKKAYEKFVYEDYSYDLFGKCETCSRNTQFELNKWISDLKDLEEKEPIEIMFVSPMEYGETIGYTYFFISKINANIREVYLPIDSLSIWDKCDVLITANPRLLETKPDDKISIKINTDYNKDSKSDYEYNSFSSFIKDENNTKKLINHE